VDGDRALFLQSGLTSAFIYNQSIPHIRPRCSSADCDWPIYGSLALCSDVIDITDIAHSPQGALLMFQARQRMQSLYNLTGASIALSIIPSQYAPVYAVVSGIVPLPTGVFNQSVVSAMHADMFIAYANEPLDLSRGFNDDDLSKFKFFELGLFWCTKGYRTIVQKGSPMTEEVSTKFEVLSPSNPQQSLNVFWNFGFSTCYMPNASTCTGYGGVEVELAPPDNLPPGSNQRFLLELWTSLALSFGTMSQLTGGLLQTAGLTTYAIVGDVHYAVSAALFGDRLGLEAYPPDVQFLNIKQMTENIARGLTNGLRSLEPSDGKPALVNGTAYEARLFLNLQAPFLTLIAAQWLGTTALLIATIVVSRRSRVEIFRNDVIAPTQVLGPLPELPGRPLTLDGIKAEAKKCAIRLETTEQGNPHWVLVPGGEGRDDIEMGMLGVEQANGDLEQAVRPARLTTWTRGPVDQGHPRKLRTRRRPPELRYN
jgi:hypothetical protein